MDPVTIGILTSVGYATIGHALGGIVENRADALVIKAYESLRNKIKEGGEIVNHDLQRIILRSFIRSLKTICNKCLNDLENKGTKQHIEWFEKKIKKLDKELKAVEKMAYVEIPTETISEIELFILPNGLLNKEKVQDVRLKLIDMATKDEDVPDCYKQKVKVTLFEWMCAYFADEYKNNDQARNIFDGQVLAGVDVKLEGQELKLDLILASLNKFVETKLPHFMEEISGKLEKLDKKFEEDCREIKNMIYDLKDNKLEQLGMKMTQQNEHNVRIIKEILRESFSDISMLLESKRGIEEMARIIKNRKIGLVVDLINSCKKKLDILGINALGPLHQTRKKMLEILNKGGTIRLLLLDPNSKAFSEREDFELDKVGRLRAEWNASLKIIEEISKNMEAGRLHVRIHGEKPRFSMIIVDNECLHYNPYSETKGTAGIYSPLEIWYNKGDEKDKFLELNQMFEKLWENGVDMLKY